MSEIKPPFREIPPELLGHSCLDPYYGTTSAARIAMFLSHIGQSPIVEGNEPRRVMTGMEMRYAESTFDIRIPNDCTILHVIRKYPTGYGDGAIKHNPVTTIIYENYYDEFKTIGVLHVPEFLSFHQDFGYNLVKNKKSWDQIQPGNLVSKDTVLAQSTAVKENKLYGMGVNANVAFISLPGTIEDGFVVSDEFIKKMAPRTYGQAVGSAGKKAFFLNTYGDDKIYKPFPDIGEKIRPDGVIFAVRDLDDDLSPAEMTPRALREIDRTFDRAVIGDPGAVVKDIKVYFDERQNPSFTPTGMDVQLRKYYDALCNYYREILNIYHGLQRRRKDKLKITEEFSQLIFEAMIYLPQAAGQRKLTRMFRLDQLDEWRVEISYESIKVPAGAYKMTDFFGGKGVICKIEKHENMPRDEYGNICDVAIFGGSTMSRSNYGRLYEHGFGAASRDLAQRLRVEVGLPRHGEVNPLELANIANNKEWIDYAFNELLDFYKIVAPTMHAMMLKHPNKSAYVSNVLSNGFSYIYSPALEQIDLTETWNQIASSRFCPNRTQLTYRDQVGKVVKTKDKILIGPLYMMLLEKIGEDWSAVASVKVQQFGLPSKLNNVDRTSTPGRESAIRSYGESETRSYNCTVGPEATVELLDQTNNPEAHLSVIEQILTHATPSNIDRAVDRSKIPFGNSRPVSLLNHLNECRGIRFRYKDANEGAVYAIQPKPTLLTPTHIAVPKAPEPVVKRGTFVNPSRMVETDSDYDEEAVRLIADIQAQYGDVQ